MMKHSPQEGKPRTYNHLLETYPPPTPANDAGLKNGRPLRCFFTLSQIFVAFAVVFFATATVAALTAALMRSALDGAIVVAVAAVEEEAEDGVYSC